jgi:hypothetical protein
MLGSQQPTSRQPGSRRPIYIALIVIIAVIIGTAAGVLAFLSGANVASAVLTGGTAFAGAALLLLPLLKLLIGRSA